MSEMLRQHLIDPLECARCNTCADLCPSSAISYQKNRYIVDPAKCDGCGECLDDCPSGSVDHWYLVPADAPYSLEDQLTWAKLPPRDAASDGEPEAEQVLYPATRPLQARVVSVTPLVGADASQDIRQIVLDMGDTPFPFTEGQSLGVLPPAPAGAGAPDPALRLYSIASAFGAGAENRVALCVKRVTEDADGNPYLGLCSNYLCDLLPGDTVMVAGPYGRHFLLPQDAGTPLLWIATGTGISAAHAMAEKRMQNGDARPGDFHLFYGARTPSDMAFREELQALDGEALRFYPAFSRHNDHPRRYAPDLLLERAAELQAVLEHPNLHVFVCGMKGLETGVLAALEEICSTYAWDWSEFLARLKAEHRLLVETY